MRRVERTTPEPASDELTPEELTQLVLNAVTSGQIAPQEVVETLSQHLVAADPWALPMVNRRHQRRETPVVYRVKVQLLDAEPPIWRRIDLRSDLMLPRLHLVLQEAMGWLNCHLHEFVHSGSRQDRNTERFSRMDYPDAGEMGELDEADVRLDELLHDAGDRLLYWYDFGDSWWHRVTVEKLLDCDTDTSQATVVTGRRACPPEDCGGIHHYNDIVAGGEAWDPEEAEYWAGWDAVAFDLDDTRQRVNDVADMPTLREVQLAEADKLRLLVTRLGDGLKLTPAGYLPPAVVRELMTATGWDEKWIGKNNREDLTFPIWQLRDWARALGLVRKYKGELRPTRRGTTLVADRSALADLIARAIPYDRLYGSPMDDF